MYLQRISNQIMCRLQTIGHLFRLSCLLCVLFCGTLQAATYPLVPAEPGQWRQEIMAFGLVTAQAKSNIMLPFSLKVTDVQVEPGLPVSTGTVLFRFRAPDLLKNISKYANHRKLLIVAEKQQEIVRKGTIEHTLTRRDVVNTEETVALYRADLELSWDTLQTALELLNNDMKRKDANVLLDKNTPQVVADILGELRAPFSGIVKNRPPQVGTWMRPNSPLLKFEDLRQVYVSVSISEKELNNWLNGETVIEKGNKIFKLKRLTGQPGIDIHSGMRQLLFKTDNPEILLRDGQWVQVMHRSPPQPVAWIPATAVVSRNNKTWCIIAEDQTYTPQQINVGNASNGKVPVLSGLKAGQQVVRENGYELLYRDLKELIQFVD
jgi:RND family efflux transporter MFP subunit